MAEVNLEQTLERIRSSKQKERTDGLADLRHILIYNRYNEEVKKVKDESYHHIIEDLFRIVETERNAYAKVPVSKKTQLASRLSQCAAALRSTVEVGIRSLRLKTVKALIRHVAETLPIAGGQYCTPLCHEYFKTLRCIFEYRPHVEHLLRQDWEFVVEFCLGCLQHFVCQSEVRPNSDYEQLLTINTELASYGFGNTASRNVTEPKLINESSRSNAIELISCLRHLHDASYYPRADHVSEICFILTKCSRDVAPSASINLETFKLINTLLPRICADTKQITLKYIKNIIPLVKIQWGTKSNALREEMLATLAYLLIPISTVILDRKLDSTRRDLESLVDVLFNDYTRRAQKDQLQLDDISLRTDDCYNTNKPVLRTTVFHLRQGVIRAENLWVQLALLSQYSSLLDVYLNQENNSDNSYNMENNAKRQRPSSHIIDNLQLLKHAHSTTKLASLQILCFMVQERELEKETIGDIVNSLLSCISGDFSIMSAWAMIALTGCVVQGGVGQSDISSAWTTVWRLTTRAVSSSICCRAACHLMDTLLRAGIARYINADTFTKQFLSSLDVNAPAIVSEASISVVIRFLNRSALDNPSTFHHNAESVLRWLFKTWRSNISEERLHLLQVAQHCQIYDITRILSVCIGTGNFVSPKSRFLVLGKLGKVFLRLWEQKPLYEYMWLVEGLRPEFEINQTCSKDDILGQTTSPLVVSVVDLLVSEIDASREKLDQFTGDRSQSVNIDYLKVIINQYLISLYMLSCLGEENINSERKLRSSSDALLYTLSSDLIRPDSEQEKIDEIYKVLAGCLPRVEIYCSRIWPSSSHRGMTLLSRNLISTTESRQALKNGDIMALENDTLNASEDLGMPNELDNGRNDEADSFDSNSLAFTDFHALRMSLETYLRFIIALPDKSNQNENSDLIIDGLLGQMTSLPLGHLLASRKLITETVTLGFPVRSDTVDEYLSFLGTQILGNYEFERSETGLLLCIDGLHRFINIWSNPKFSAAYETASDIYCWFVDTALKSGILSNRTKIALSDLLFEILEASPNFGHDMSLPSARTILLEVLRKGEITIKWHIAQRIPELFKRFALGKHEAIFRDVCDNLPTDVDWEEGISIRILFFGRLGSAWSTLLRLCVYHLFETAGSVKSSGQYASNCIAEITKSLRLPCPRDLLKLFAPQLLYTWLESQSATTIPYFIFQFKDLETLLQDVEQEVVGQLVMRAKSDEISSIAVILGSSEARLLEKSIVNSAAYSIAWDTCLAGTKLTSIGSEIYLRSKLEKDNYRKLIQLHLPQILSVLFVAMEQEHNIEKAFQKRPAYKFAAIALNEMKANGSSILQLPAGQQPSFNARFLPDQIERVARRAMVDPNQLWTENLYVFVFRMLVQKLDSSLDTLHACSIIRKIRILLCLVGKAALSGYALKITLHSLRPFIGNIQCADDTYGLIKYLLEHGKSDLSSSISFMAGFLVPTILSLREFTKQEYDCTTQESHFKATISKAQDFDSWLINYYRSFCLDITNGTKEEVTDEYHKYLCEVDSLDSLVSICCDVEPFGNATAGTPESNLLIKLLEDAKSAMPLFGEASRVLALNLLTKNFTEPQSQREDILGRNSSKPEYIPVLLRLSQQGLLSNRSFSIWVAKTVGRFYSSHDIGLEIGRACATFFSDQPEERIYSAVNSSRVEIISYLHSCVFANDLRESTLAERALRAITTHARNSKEASILKHILDPSILNCLNLHDYGLIDGSEEVAEVTLHSLDIYEGQSVNNWSRNAAAILARHAENDAVLGPLVSILTRVSIAAKKLFPYVLHLVLEKELHKDRQVYKIMSDCCKSCFRSRDRWKLPFVRPLTSTIFYLRSQRISGETTIVDRERWLSINYIDASKAAIDCKMYSAALLLLELHSDQGKRSFRRSSEIVIQSVPNELLLQVYKSIDEPDSFYGVHASPGLYSVLDRLDYENDGLRSLLFRGAKLDSQMRRIGRPDVKDSHSVLQSLAILNLNSLTYELLSHDSYISSNSSKSTVLDAARKLEQWEIKVSELDVADSSGIFKAFQGLSSTKDISAAQMHIDNIINSMIQSYKYTSTANRESRSFLKNLSVLSEIHDLVCAPSNEEFKKTCETLLSDYKIMGKRRLDDIRMNISSRETTFSLLGNNESLRRAIGTSRKICRLMEVQALLASSKVYREHKALHESLASITYLTDLLTDCKNDGLEVNEALRYEMAAMLWESNEASTSIGILNQLKDERNQNEQSILVGRSKILTTLGHHIAEARIEKPEEVINRYLLKAIKELKGEVAGNDAGEVYHEFAAFCDKQLHNVEHLADFNRLQMLKTQKEAEMRALAEMLRNPLSNEEKRSVKSMYDRARQWYAIDEREYERLRIGRDAFLQQSLENYLLSLQADDEHNSDVLRMFSLWLDHYESPLANHAVAQHVSRVPSLKFASLMNQLSSRLQARKSDFQKILSKLVLRICIDHPYHSMYHIYSGVRTTGGKDEVARSRNAAAIQISKLLTREKLTGQCWVAIHNSSNYYYDLAKFRPKENGILKSGRDYLLEDFPASKKVSHRVPTLNVPPATMHIKLRSNCDYTNIPRIVRWELKMTIASGISAPKVLTAVTSNGQKYKQLFKGGNDDLRQDAIMEQVFEQVSSLLKNHRVTQERKLQIRTYKVLPLSADAGIIEFVRDTIPLFNYLMPAHEKYYPKDWKQSTCREKIGQAVGMSVDSRTKVFRDVLNHFHPVGRYFFFERFMDPDEWFDKRLAYTRSTAAISILGYILGLGDRHCHNILLDERNGDVVHIDLGVAFEAGRVLPVPELVPFRLTRDIIDAMGITGIEGVFRRCCEFVMDTLREERENIMTLLNVLRYDPLYSWTVSPLKAKRMRDAQNGQDGAQIEDFKAIQADVQAEQDESDEANRALAVVERKLSKTLSTAATVNELIQQATDERNLALLFHGWAAYA